MARHVGVHQTTISRIWRAHELRPHRIETFKVSTNPEFVTKLRYVVGLYLDPPKRVVVFSVDEKSSNPGVESDAARASVEEGARWHDDTRLRTAWDHDALCRVNVASGEIHHECRPGHRWIEFLQFMTGVERMVPGGLSMHVILDNEGTHKTPEVERWLKRQPRVHFHFTRRRRLG